MLTKVAFGLAFVLASASVVMAATHVKPRTDGRKVSRPAPTVASPAENCDSGRVHFPACSGGGGGGY